ncbi:MAG: histidinol-phosphate transaminase [Campylobacteraceae bacterium]|jgi:histidinol-phosphate aminotransferase|nr:histidinol-phosphate transaminase [Campylobacteraceae bacterium]
MVFNKTLDNLNNYEAGKPIELVVREYGVNASDVIKVASNENPYGCSKRAVEAVRAETLKMNLYPDDSMYELKEALAQKYGVKSHNIIIGSGSDQIIEFSLFAKANPSNKILMAKTTFAMYEIYGKRTGTNILKTTSEGHDLQEFIDIYKANENVAVVFLCLPNNPLGECLGKQEVFEFLEQISPDTLAVIDGAYQEFAAYKDEDKKIDPKELIETFPNTIYLGTFSKAYGLGGMRTGYGVGDVKVISALSKLRSPFNITTLSLKAAIEALKDEEFIKMTVSKNFEQMRRYEEFAYELDLEFIQSYTNFITYKFGAAKNSSDICEKLMRQGIIIRDLKSYGMNAARITIGTKEQNDKILRHLKAVYQG